MKRMWILTVVIALVSLATLAQEKKADKKGEMKHDHAATEKGGAPPMPKPAPEMTKLIKMFSGTWTANEKVEANAMGNPKALTGTGTAVFKPGPGGFTLIEEYNSPKGAMGPFTGHGITWWDAKSNSYKGTWCDSMAPECMTNSMKWEGDKLVSTPVEMDMGGKKTTTTMQYTEFKPDSITFEMGMGPTAAEAKTGMTIVYKKGGTATPAAKKEDAKK